MKPSDFRSIREMLKLTQEQLGLKLKRMTGFGSRQLVAKIEAGKTPIKQHIEKAITKLKKEK